MDNGFLWEEYKTEWIINLSNSVCTPVCTPSRWNDLILWFEIQYRKKDSTNYNYRTKSNETVLKDFLEVFANGHFPNSGKTNLVIFLTICYNYNDYSCHYPELKNFKLISNSPFKRLSVGEVNSIISEAGDKTSHGSYIISGSILLRCHVFISGHLGSVSSHFQIQSSFNNQSTFLKDFASIYNNKTCSDLEIRIEDKAISVHKLVLVAHSPVFKKMMEHECLESKTNTITITDATFEVFECFLMYLYSGDIPEGFEGNIDELCALADKYDVGPLKEDCFRRMVQNIDMKNICKILPLVYDSKDEEVKKQANSFAVENFIQLRSSAEWQELVKSHLQIGYSITKQVCDAYIKFETSRNNISKDEEEVDEF